MRGAESGLSECARHVLRVARSAEGGFPTCWSLVQRARGAQHFTFTGYTEAQLERGLVALLQRGLVQRTRTGRLQCTAVDKFGRVTNT